MKKAERKSVSRGLKDRKEEVKKDLEFLYGKTRVKTALHKHLREKKKLCLSILILSFLLTGIFSGIFFFAEDRGEQSRITRPQPGEEDQRNILVARTQSGEKTQIEVQIPARKLTGTEAEACLDLAEELLAVLLPGENPGLEEVRTDLYMPALLDGLPVEISWESDRSELVSYDGSVDNSLVTSDQGEIAVLAAKIECEDITREVIYQIKVLPALKTPEENWQETLKQEILNSEQKNPYEATVSLPTIVEGRKITWSWKQEKTWLLFLIAGPVAAVFLSRAKDDDLHKEAEKKKRRLERGYTGFVSKLVMLVGAGFPIRAAIRRIGEDYERKKKRTGKYQDVYEEILRICREMESGITELEAYEHLGMRCELACYRKCASLLAQNSKRGSDGLLTALYQEAEEAFEARRNLAKREGEEAGTKLLLPMMLMLLIMMILVMVPACFSFAGL